MILVSEVSWAKSASKRNRGRLEVQPRPVFKTPHDSQTYVRPAQAGRDRHKQWGKHPSFSLQIHTGLPVNKHAVVSSGLHSLPERMTRGSILTFYSHLFILVYLSNRVIKHSRTFAVIVALRHFSIKH